MASRPQERPGNLATVLTWVHYRGLLVVALLAAGNLCAVSLRARSRLGRHARAGACRGPETQRQVVRHLALRAVLFSYELFDSWPCHGRRRSWSLATSPRRWRLTSSSRAPASASTSVRLASSTSWRRRCRRPSSRFENGQLASLVARLTASPEGDRRRRLAGLCSVAVNWACIYPRRSATSTAHSAWTAFTPVHTTTLRSRLGTPGLELADARRRSGIGRLINRPDIAVLAVLFGFGALLNAFAMVSPAYSVEAWLAQTLGSRSEPVVLGCLFVVGLGIAPLVLLGSAASLTRALGRDQAVSTGRIALRYAYGLVPFGFSMWLAHYGFHFLTGALTVVPVTQSAAIDLMGSPVLGNPVWRWAGMRPGAVFPIQLGCILLGIAGSVAVMHVISRRDYPSRPNLAAVPWAILVALLGAAAIWISLSANGDERNGTGGVRSHVLVGSVVVLLFTSGPALGHAGPPIPLVSNRIVGPYKVSIWADPDSTDDGTAAGRFWITLARRRRRARGAGRDQPLDRAGPTIGATAQSEAGNASQLFSALVMDHEGRFQVRVTIDGPLGPAAVEAEVDATYDLRPPPGLVVVYLLPFVAVGFLWLKLLPRRAPAARARPKPPSPPPPPQFSPPPTAVSKGSIARSMRSTRCAIGGPRARLRPRRHTPSSRPNRGCALSRNPGASAAGRVGAPSR